MNTFARRENISANVKYFRGYHGNPEIQATHPFKLIMGFVVISESKGLDYYFSLRDLEQDCENFYNSVICTLKNCRMDLQNGSLALYIPSNVRSQKHFQCFLPCQILPELMQTTTSNEHTETPDKI